LTYDATKWPLSKLRGLTDNDLRTLAKPIITPEELDSLLDRRRYEGERIHNKNAIRRARQEIRRLRIVLQEIYDRTGAVLSE
jgi:hypothetical protein